MKIAIITYIIKKIMSIVAGASNWWQCLQKHNYSAENTLKKIKIGVTANENSCIIDCGNVPYFELWIEISNHNPFEIDIDKIVAKASFGYSAQLEAHNLIGTKIELGETARIQLKSQIHPSQIIIIKNTQNEDSKINHCEINVVMTNKHGKIRHAEHFDNLMCKVKNKIL